jgi:hypothetical protein
MLNNLKAGTISKGAPGIYEVSGMLFILPSGAPLPRPLSVFLSFLALHFFPVFSPSSKWFQTCISPGANKAKIWSSMSTVAELRTEI